MHNYSSVQGYIMHNGDLVLYGGVLSDGVHLVCDQQWSSTLGLPLANRSYDWRVQVSEAGEYGVCVHVCVHLQYGRAYMHTNMALCTHAHYVRTNCNVVTSLTFFDVCRYYRMALFAS